MIEELTMDTYEPLYIRNATKYFLTEEEILGEGTIAGEEAFETGATKNGVVTKRQGKKTQTGRKGKKR